MNVYAIHKEGVWTTHYNIAICSTKKLAEKTVQELNKEYDTWLTEKKLNEFTGDNGTAYMNFVHNNPQPPKFRIEKIQVFTK